MRKSPLKRKSQLRPKKRIKRKPPRRLKSAKADAKYLARVRELPCVLHKMAGYWLLTNHPLWCEGPIEAHHAGQRGVGQKCHDHEAIPMCRKHHRQVTDHTGYFADWSRKLRRQWHDWRIEETQTALGLHTKGEL